MAISHLCAFKNLLNENTCLPKYTFLIPSFYVSVFRNFSYVLCSTLKNVVSMVAAKCLLGLETCLYFAVLSG